MTTAVRTASTANDPISDGEIVQRVVAGDAALFEMLIRRHNQRIYRAVRAVLRDDDDVEDVMQQAYLNAYQHLHQFTGSAQFSTWLTRIAVNEALGRRRKRLRLAGEGEDELMNLADTEARDPEQQASASEMREVLEREVAALPDAFRTVLVMRDVEGMNTADTASCLDVSEDLVKTRLHRARAMLRDRLYERAGVTLQSIFEFGNARCDRLVAEVMDRIRNA
ncbi:MAG: RNA polymerase sigma factor [Thermoanaerobaculia bacterium]